MISKFFIERPVLANVLAVLMIVIGGVALFRLPVAQYPNVVPPTISVTTRYPGASARAVVDTVALPIEQQVNGVDGMIYMQSYSASDGSYSLIVTFKIGMDINFAQVLVQNRVSSALAQLPQAVQAQGVTVQQIVQARWRLYQHGIRAGFFIQLGYLDEQLEDILATRDLIANDHEIETAGMRVQPKNRRQHKHRRNHGVHEKLHRCVDFALVSKDADQQGHRDQRRLPEEIKEEEVERGEDADQRGLHDQQQDEKFLYPVVN